MAERLLKYYKYIFDEGGLEAKMKLAIVTKIPSTKAATEPDSEQNIEMFKDAIMNITGKPAPTL